MPVERWVIAQGMIPIPGTTKPHRLEENFASREIELTADEQKDFATLLAAAIGSKLGGEYGRVSFTPEKYISSLR